MNSRIVAGHSIPAFEHRCEKCGRSVHDVLSIVREMRSAGVSPLNQEDIACVGRLNNLEMGQIIAEEERRARDWKNLCDVVTA